MLCYRGWRVWFGMVWVGGYGQVRDEDLRPIEGVEIGDIGTKVSGRAGDVIITR